jgi:hypothetical protein
MRDKIVSKVAYEWKAIFKALNRLDLEQTEFVTASQFERCCESVGVNTITKDDLQGLLIKYGHPEQSDSLNYFAMSKDLGLHTSRFNYVH